MTVTSPAPAIVEISQLVKDFEARQHALSWKEAIKEHWKPIAWCFYMFFTCIMYGFDSLAGGVVVSITEFRKDFGYKFGNDYVVDANWQLGFVAATLAGIVFGGLMTGFGMNIFGRQICILTAYVINTGGIFLQYFATTPAHFFGGKILMGIPLGVFVTVAPSYSSEMAPLGRATDRIWDTAPNSNVYRRKTVQGLVPTQWGYVIVGLAILPFLPESPYWLIAHGKHDKARANITKLHGPNYDVDGHLAEIHDSLARLNADKEAQGSIAECFSRQNIRRTIVCTFIFFIQNATGSVWVIGYMSYFMQLGGMSPKKSFDTTIGIAGLMVVGNMFRWLWIEWLGRRGTALIGTGLLAATLLLIGILAIAQQKGNTGAIWGQGFVYQGTIGSAAWVISSENSTSRLRSPTQSLVTMMSGLSSCIWSFSLPYAINPDRGNLGGKIAFIFGAVMVAACCFVFFLVPETKGRSFIEIDELYRRGVPAWKWKTIEVVTILSAGSEDGGTTEEKA